MFTEETEKSSGSLSLLARKCRSVANRAATSSVTTPQTGPIKSACESIKNSIAWGTRSFPPSHLELLIRYRLPLKTNTAYMKNACVGYLNELCLLQHFNTQTFM